ncbi:P-loop NTPase fold protein [Pseudomonas alliivorans]|nr:P-loop NTPase fold protein [Pseudomonas alliivorans]
MVALWTRLSLWLASFKKQTNSDGLPADEIWSDAPIRLKAEDRLRRAEYADRIASVLLHLSPREGRVFAIRGGWGFGKSSLKNLVTEQLKDRGNDANWLDFNPWQWGDGGAISRALFGQIADRLGGGHSKHARKRAAALRRYGSILTGASAPLKKASGSKDTISAVLTNGSMILVASAIGFDLPSVAKILIGLAVVSSACLLIGRALLHFGRDRSSESLDQIRGELEQRLRELERPLVVFVDDIDRLEPEQIRELLKQVKANANLPNIVFVLLFQPSIVESALTPIANGDGRAFLAKIVQASFDLPAVPPFLVHSILGEELALLAGRFANQANEFSEARWGNAYANFIQPSVRNLRDAKRLLTSVTVHLPLHVSNDVFEVNIVDFLVLEAVRVFEPDLHEILIVERDLVLQKGRFQSDNREDQNRTAAKRLLEKIPEHRRAVAQEALTDLFPALEWAFGGMAYGPEFRQQWHAEKRVCASRYFSRYFELQTAVGEISEASFLRFIDAIASEEALKEMIDEVDAQSLLPSLVARLDESAHRLPTANAQTLLTGMFSIAQRLVHLRGNGFSSPWISAWRSISSYLRRIPDDIRGRIATDALRDTKALSVAAMLIHLSDPADYKQESGREFDPVLDLNTVNTLRAVWLQLMRSRAEDDHQLIDQPDLVSLLYIWEKFEASPTRPRGWVAAAIETDDGFAKMASRMLITGTIRSWGDSVSVPHHTFKRETIQDFIGVEVAKARCDAINPADFPDHEEALRVLLRQLEVWLGLREGDPFDSF